MTAPFGARLPDLHVPRSVDRRGLTDGQVEPFRDEVPFRVLRVPCAACGYVGAYRWGRPWHLGVRCCGCGRGVETT